MNLNLLLPPLLKTQKLSAPDVEKVSKIDFLLNFISGNSTKDFKLKKSSVLFVSDKEEETKISLCQNIILKNTTQLIIHLT
jgi:hypothetical protein